MEWVVWKGGNSGHELIVGGCGGGYYYLHDPWGWYGEMGFPQPQPWQGLTYGQILNYYTPTAIGSWVSSVMWDASDAAGHAAALANAKSLRGMAVET